MTMSQICKLGYYLKRDSNLALVYTAGPWEVVAPSGLSFPNCTPRRQGDATLPLLPWLCPESAVRCQVSRNLGGVDATSLCGPSVTFGGAGQGPDWTGISVLLGTHFALANFPR